MSASILSLALKEFRLTCLITTTEPHRRRR